MILTTMTAKEILEKLLSHTGLTINSLATEIGLSRAQALYDIQNEKTKSITPSMADRIIQRFSDIDRVWLLTGEGDMLGGHDPRTEPTEFTLDKLEKAKALAKELGVELIPMFSEPFKGGNDGYNLIEAWNEVESVWTMPDVKADMIIPVVGDSMAPTFPSGARLAVTRVWFRPDEPLSIPFGEAFAIVLHNPDDPDPKSLTSYVKRICKHDNVAKCREYWIAHSDNSRYEDFEIPISHVVGLWRVRASVAYYA